MIMYEFSILVSSILVIYKYAFLQILRISIACKEIRLIKGLFICISIHRNWIDMVVRMKIKDEFPKRNINNIFFNFIETESKDVI